MKKIFCILTVVVSAAFLSSCTKENQAFDEPKEIIIAVDDSALEVGVETKTTAVNSLPSALYHAGTTGTRGNSAEAKKWASTSKSVSASKVATGYYQTKTATSYNHYLSNVAITTPATGNVTVAAANSTDVIVGWVAAQTTATPSITMNHIFARTGTLTLTPPSGGSVSDVTWSIVQKNGTNITGTAGTYNLSTGAWTAATTRLTSATALTNSTDFYLLPGTYTLTCSFSYSHGDYSNTFTKSGDVTLVQGKTNNITASFTEPASQIIISTTLTAWSAQAVSVSL